MTLICSISAVGTVCVTSATEKADASRDATDREIAGATYADGPGTAVPFVVGDLRNMSISQNVGIAGMTGAIILVLCGFLPKIGTVITSKPLPVLVATSS